METPKAEIKREHKRFCELYVLYGNKTKAYMEVYPDASYDSAKSLACQLFTNVNLVEYINELQDDISKLCQITAIKNAQELAKIAYANMTNYYSSYGTLIPFSELTDEQKSAICELGDDITTFGEDKTIISHKTKLKLHDKLKALDMLNKMVGSNGVDKIEHSGTIQAPPLNISIDGKEIKLK